MSKTATVKLKTEGVKELTSDLTSATKAADKLEGSLDKTADAADDVGDASKQMSGGLDKMSGGLITMFKGAVRGAKTFVLGLKTMRGAVIATGIGALVLVIGSLVAYFTSTKKGAEMLEVATAALGIIMGKLTDVLSSLGGLLVSAFQNPQEAIASLNSMMSDVWDWFVSIGTYIKESFILNILVLQRSLKKAAIAAKEFFGGDASEMKAELAEIESAIVSTLEELKKAAEEVTGPLLDMYGAVVDGVKELVSETTKAVKAQNSLTKASQRLRQAERDLIVDEAAKLAIIAKQEVISKDITKSYAERLEANKLAQEAEASVHAQRVANAEEKLRIHQEEMGLTKSLEADYQREAELIAAVTNLDTQSAKLKKKFTVEEKMLKEQMDAEAKAIDDAELLRIATLKAATQSAQQNEVDALELKYLKLNEMAQGNAETEKLLKEKQEADLLAIEKKYIDAAIAAAATGEKTKQEKRQETIDAVVAMTNAAFSLFAALDAGRDSDDKKTAKARFKRAKAMQIAGAVMSTGSAIIGALSPPPVGLGPTPAGFAASITAALTGAASIATISKTRFDSGGTPDTPSAPTAGGNQTTALVPDTFAPSNTAPTDLESITNKPIKAYVVGQDMTSQQALDANLLHHATL